MLTVGLVTLGIGVFLIFGSFVFSAVNMGRAVSNLDGISGSMFTRHIASMIGMAFGGLVSAIGAVISLIAAVQMFVH